MCDGNGIVEINEFRQTENCDQCNGTGMIYSNTNLLKPDGPYIIQYINCKIVGKEDGPVYGTIKTKDEQDWVTIKHTETDEIISVHQMYAFDTQDNAKNYIDEYNQIKKAEQQAQAQGLTGSPPNGGGIGGVDPLDNQILF